MQKVTFKSDMEIPKGLPLFYKGEQVGEVVEANRNDDGYTILAKITGEMPDFGEGMSASMSSRVASGEDLVADRIDYLDKK